MKSKIITVLMLIAYIAVLMKVMVFKDVPLIRMGDLMINFGGSQTGPPNLMPFKTILIYLLGEKGLMIGAINLIGNIVLLLPVGLLLPLAYRNVTWRKMVVFAGLAGFAIEALQVVLQVGIFDIDDVILNGLGVMMGYWIFKALAKKMGSLEPKNIRVAAVIALAILGAAAVYGFQVYRSRELPFSFEPRPRNGGPEQINHREGNISSGADPCGGSGGTGQIVGISNHSITIRRGDGLKEILKLTGDTEIRDSAGAILESSLKIGNRVTIVTLESDQDGIKIARAVLVCNAVNQ